MLFAGSFASVRKASVSFSPFRSLRPSLPYFVPFTGYTSCLSSMILATHKPSQNIIPARQGSWVHYTALRSLRPAFTQPASVHPLSSFVLACACFRLRPKVLLVTDPPLCLANTQSQWDMSRKTFSLCKSLHSYLMLPIYPSLEALAAPITSLHSVHYAFYGEQITSKTSL